MCGVRVCAAKESVGRHLQVQVVPTKMSQKQKWLKACIIEFNAATGQHKVSTALLAVLSLQRMSSLGPGFA